MYKVFVNNSLIILTENDGLELNDKSVRIDYTSPSQLSEIVELLLQDGSEMPIVINHFDIDELWTAFVHQFTYVHAAGGIVFNEKSEFLVIHRNQKWDLPKGHLEKGEKPEFAGMREVEEECGVQNLTITDHLANTFHMYERDGLTLKKTYWYMMKSTSKEILIPQIEEGIDKVEWRNESDISELVENTFPIVKELLYAGVEQVKASRE